MAESALPIQSGGSAQPGGYLETDLIQVLLVGDTATDAHLLQQMLAGVKMPHFGLVPVERLSDALVCLGEYTIDVILLDLSLSQDQDLAALSRLQTRRPEIPIVALTDRDNPQLATRIIRKGAQDHLVKGDFDSRLLARVLLHAIERKHSEAALRESESQYRSLFEDSPISLWEEDFSEVKMFIDGLYASGVTDIREHLTNNLETVVHCASLVKILNVNQASVSLFQAQDKDQLLGNLNDLLSDAAYSAFRKELIALASGHTEYQNEIAGQTSTGKVIHRLVKLSIAPGYEDTWAKVFVSVLNITERKQAEEALRESEMRFRAVTQTSPDGIISMDSTGTILSWNNGAESIFGYSEAEILGRSLTVLLPGGDREAFLQGMERMRTTGERPHMVDRTTEWQGLRKDGTEVPLELSVGIWETDGEPVLNSIVRDVSERKQAEAALQMWWEIFEHAEWGVMVSDPDSMVLGMMNPAFARMHGYTVQELVGTPMAALFAPGYRDDLPDHIRAVHEQGHHTFESVHVRKDGSIFPVLINATAVKDEAGKVLYRVGNVQDLTEFKKLEDAATHAYLLQAELEKEKQIVSLKDRFISIVSHEFRTPLAVIQTANDMLTHYFDRLDPPKRLQLLQKIKDQTQHIVRLIDDTLEINRAQASRTEMNPQPTNLGSFCKSILEQVRFIDDSEHHFQFTHYVPDTPTLIDVSMVRHILTNLLSNAIKYSDSGSTIRFDVSCEADEVIFQIADEGIGIPEDDLRHLFEPFHRATNVGAIQGTGLGLSIAKQYAESHGGQLEIFSEEGKGTTATVRLPLHYTRV